MRAITSLTPPPFRQSADKRKRDTRKGFNNFHLEDGKILVQILDLALRFRSKSLDSGWQVDVAYPFEKKQALLHPMQSAHEPTDSLSRLNRLVSGVD